MVRAVLGASLCFTVFACGGEGGGDRSLEVVCETKLSATEGARPTYEFQGPVMSIAVVRQSEPDIIVWGLATPDRDGVTGPVRHGDRPEGAVTTSRREPTLKLSVDYTLRIQRVSGEVCFQDFQP